MKVLLLAASVSLLAWGLPAAPARAHGGGLDANGCHTQRSTGQYHCHGGGAPRVTAVQPLFGGGAFANCDEARAAGRSNIRLGEPGYGPHLDRDGDGIACEG